MAKIKKLKINGTEYEFTGKSAYELACEQGFEGTEVEWLASLKGEPGAPGVGLEPVEVGLEETITDMFTGLVSGRLVDGVPNTQSSYQRTDYIDLTAANSVRVKIKTFTPVSETTERALWCARYDKDKNFIKSDYFKMYPLTENGDIDTTTPHPNYDLVKTNHNLCVINTDEHYQHGLGLEISPESFGDGTVYIILNNLKAGDVVDMSVEGVANTPVLRYVLTEDMMPASVMEDIDALKATTREDIVLSDYVPGLVDDIALAAKAHMKEDSLCLVLFTDTHYTAKHTCFPTLIARKLAEATNASAILHLGDLVDLCEEDKAIGLEIFQRHSKILHGTKIPYLQVVGNHDDGQMYLHDCTQDYNAENYIKAVEMYHATTKQSRHYITLGSKNGWYYMDDEDSKTRLIVLNSHEYPWVVNEDGTLAYDHRYAPCIYSTKQLEWIANTALNFADKGDVIEQGKWSVLAFAHQGTGSWAALNSLFRAFLTGTKKVNFINADNDQIDIYGLYDYSGITITNDFSLVGPRKLAFFCGDIHKDSIVPWYGTAATFLDCKLEWDKLGTPNEAAISVLVVTPSESTITELRFGEGTKTVNGVTTAIDPLTEYDNYRTFPF